MSDRPTEIANDPVRIGISIRPFRLGRFSGDQAGVWLDADTTLICMVDGLGHGEDAELAARKAVHFVEKNRGMDLAEMMQGCDEELRGSRGAAMAVTRIDKSTGTLEYTSVGNTRCAIIGHKIQYLGGIYGIVGEGINPTIIEQRQLGRRDLVLFWTDGLPETLRLVATRVRRTTNAQAFADELIDEFAIEDDDAGVVVVRWDA